MSDKKTSVLIVDDTPANIDVLKEILNPFYQIKVATSGEKCLKIASTHPLPDLILLDIMMPQMDGYEVCERLKANPETKNIPVIFVTAKSEIEDEIKGFKIGAVDYITKPISPPLVIARVKTHISLHNQALLLEDLVKKQTSKLNDKIEELDVLSKLQSYENSSLSIEEAECVLLENFKLLFDIKQASMIFPKDINHKSSTEENMPQYSQEELTRLPSYPHSQLDTGVLSHGCFLTIAQEGRELASIWYLFNNMNKFESEKIERFTHISANVLKTSLLRIDIEQGFGNLDDF
jgi:CheY-like chemotaxis protein